MDFADFAVVRKTFVAKFPIVDEYLREYERILVDISSRYGVRLYMRYDGGKGIAVFYMDAKIETKGLDAQTKIESIKLHVNALKEALSRIEKYEAKSTSR